MVDNKTDQLFLWGVYPRPSFTYQPRICAQRSSDRLGEFRVDCCGNSITSRSHRILTHDVHFQSTGPRTIGFAENQVRFGLSLGDQQSPRRHIPLRSSRSSINEAGENHGSAHIPSTHICPSRAHGSRRGALTSSSSCTVAGHASILASHRAKFGRTFGLSLLSRD